MLIMLADAVQEHVYNSLDTQTTSPTYGKKPSKAGTNLVTNDEQLKATDPHKL